MCKYILYIIIVFAILPMELFAQTLVKVDGSVRDQKDELLIGVNVIVKGARGKGVVTDVDGRYSIMVGAGDELIFSYIGYISQEIKVGNKDQELNVVLKPSSESLDEVSVVGYGTQRKVSVVGAITSIAPQELARGGVTSITNALAGRVAGLIGVQRSGEPGEDVSEFWIRGISTFGAKQGALILIDGIERSSINEVAPEDIESFSILKDATATAVYGARGANGVVIINTKRGKEGKMNISANVKTMIETLPRLPKYVGAYDYARLANEAKVVRGDKPLYSEGVFDIIKYNMDPDLYPDVNWQDEILKKRTWGLQANINISGGGGVARYYMSGFYRTNDAIYNQSGMNKYNTNVRRDQYSFRSNIDVNVTKTTRLSLLLSVALVDMNRPGMGTTSQIWEAQANLTPMTVPVRYSNGLLPAYGKGDLASPAVLLNETGFMTENENTVESKLVLEQDFKSITPGLKATAALSFDNQNFHTSKRYKMPDLYKALERNWVDGGLIMDKRVVASPLAYSTSSYGIRTIYFEAKVDYNRVFADRHRVGALVLYNQKDYVKTNASNEINSIPEKDQGLAGRFTYSYDDIYFGELNFGYNGSENFPKGQRFGFFPSVACGWVISNYKFFKDHVPFISLLKFRYSYGLVGNDEISGKRFPYLTYLNTSASGFNFGDRGENSSGGVTESEMGATSLVWEKAKKQNFGLELTFWDKLSFTLDVFRDMRDGIFMERSTLPDIVGISVKPYGNVGKMKSWGADGNASFHHKVGEFDFEVRGNFTLTRDKILDYDEPVPLFPYKGHKGRGNEVTRGLVALGLFKDEADIENSPTQFGTKLLPGDIKYKDVNGDGKIDDDDIVPIGKANVPKLQYGFAGSVTWRNFDFNIFFRGASQVDYFYGGSGFYPFSGGETGNILTIVNNQANRWTPASYSGDPATENPNARFPRMTYGENKNNNRNSTFWLADASYLRLKTVEIGYTLPDKFLNKIRMKNLRLSVIGDNLHLWDKVKLWDPEQASSNGAVYPLTRSYTFTLSVQF